MSSPWPDPRQDAARQKQVFDAMVAAAQEHAKAVDARAQAEADAELANHAEFHKALMTVAQGSVERARASAETVQKAATAILALYTAVLGAAFSVTENALPSRGVIPTLFLGTAVVFSTAYLAYLTTPGSSPAPRATGGFRPAAMERTRRFIEWAGATARHRAYWLRASVVALGVALMFLPAPFLGPLPLLDRLTPAPEQAADTRPAWPSIPPGSSADLALRKIRYQAEVDEVAAKRAAAAPARVDANRSWWWGAALGVLAVLLFPLLVRGRSKPATTSGLPHPSARQT
jgi:hypothetical protein